MKHKFDIDVDAVSHEELKSAYRRLLTSRNSLKSNNDALSEWQWRINEAVTSLSGQVSVAFQAMAEKAGVRSHKSVADVVRLLDYISHPQWKQEGDKPNIKFPIDWDFDDQTAWSGDADMTLNSPIHDAIALLDDLLLEVKPGYHKDIRKVIAALHGATTKGINGIKEVTGFKPVHFSVPTKHANEMSREELRELVSALGWAALDLAQDMQFANYMLRRDLRAASYRRICGDLYALSQMSVEPHNDKFDIKVFGGETPE